ncbi:MAG: hypothetical protein DMG14_23960 [Acidobacteria bacterium]|nr:MAG: hypothetical protein DMG14_23960 [Acidobacteriota bacterium]
MSGAREAQGRQAAAVINASPTRSASAVARSPKRGRSHQEIVRVLIVGAGPVGLVMAHELARYGVECRVIDKQRDRPITSRAVAILPRTIEVFDLMRLADDFLGAAGKFMRSISLVMESGSLVSVSTGSIRHIPSRWHCRRTKPSGFSKNMLCVTASWSKEILN